MYKVRLLRLHCYRQDESDGDEIFIKYEKKKVWPASSKYEKLKVGDRDVKVDLNVEADTEMEVELWDYDLFTPNDKLGTFNMLVNEKGGPFTTDLKRVKGSDDARYSLEWEVS